MKKETYGAYLSEYGIIFKDDDVDWLNCDECIKISALVAYKREMNYYIYLYPKGFIDYLNYWSMRF